MLSRLYERCTSPSLPQRAHARAVSKPRSDRNVLLISTSAARGKRREIQARTFRKSQAVGQLCHACQMLQAGEMNVHERFLDHSSNSIHVIE